MNADERRELLEVMRDLVSVAATLEYLVRRAEMPADRIEEARRTAAELLRGMADRLEGRGVVKETTG